MRIGVTASQEGLSERQIILIREMLVKLNCTELHHGDCLGGDADIHQIALQLDIDVVIHPPENESKRAFCDHAIKVHRQYPYLERNRHIVDATDYLLGCPNTMYERLRSGTWSTIRYARKIDKPYLVILPFERNS